MCLVFQPVVLQQPDRINSNTKILKRVFFSFINKWDQVFKSWMEGTNYTHKTYNFIVWLPIMTNETKRSLYYKKGKGAARF